MIAHQPLAVPATWGLRASDKRNVTVHIKDQIGRLEHFHPLSRREQRFDALMRSGRKR
jgi:hypothetical protein